MAGLTLAQAQQHLSEWLAADTAVSKGQSYSIGARAFSRADAAEITEKIKFWQTQVNKLSRGGSRTRRVVPR